MKCQGRNKPDHCCYFEGKACRFIEKNTEPGFRWSCGLRRELGSWDAVLADPRYVRDVLPKHEARAKRIGIPVSNCRDYPSDPEKCTYCGANC